MIKKYEKINLSIDNFVSGFIAIIGVPNAGKSTLLNLLLGHKISITSQKPQTTRNRILGILTRPLAQFVFIDTPGVHAASGPMNTRIVDVAFDAIIDVDLILFVVDVANQNPIDEGILLNKLKTNKKPIVLILNKIDKINNANLLKTIASWSTLYKFTDIIPTCALITNQVKIIISTIQDNLPFGLPLFPSNTFTDMSDKFIISEIIREKVFRLTGQEIPYSVAVSIDNFKEKNKHLFIHATIHVERNSQKGIIIGKNAKKLKQIGKTSRINIEKLYCMKVFLKLFIRVQKNWSKDTKALRKFGY